VQAIERTVRAGESGGRVARSREQSFPLSTNCYPGAVHPSGYQFCTGFTADPWPTWTFECRNSTVQREIFTVHGRDLVIVRWSLLGKKKLRAILRVRPKLSGRDYHATHHENGNLSTDASTKAGTVAWRLYTDLPPIQAFHAGDYRHGPEWYRQVEFPVEQQRGLFHREDWWSPEEFTFSLTPGSTATLTFTSEAFNRLDVPSLTKREQARRIQLTQAASSADPLAGALWRATNA